MHNIGAAFKNYQSPHYFFGIEYENGVYIPWLEKSGPVAKGSSLHSSIYNDFYDNKTINDDNTHELYLDTQSSGTLYLWNIDYMMNHVLPTHEHSN